jgi:hypothetical protein
MKRLPGSSRQCVRATRAGIIWASLGAPIHYPQEICGSRAHMQNDGLGPSAPGSPGLDWVRRVVRGQLNDRHS